MATLTISHYLYLDRDQRYGLHNGNSIETTGIAVPVWFKKGNTSEPAPEIFCEYKLVNNKTGANIFRTTQGYTITMPHIELIGESKKSDDPEVEKMYDEVLKAYQKKVGTTDRLLDAEDGGVESVEFRYYHKVEIDNKLHHVIHFVEIKPIDILVDTLS